MVKHEAAKALFFDGWAQKDIARLLKVSEKTVVQWKKKYKWEELRQRYAGLRNSAADKIMELINYQLEVLNRIKDRYDQQMTGDASLDELNQALIQNGQIDALYKMFAAVKGKEITWASYVRIVRELHEYLAAHDIQVAQALAPLADDFLNTKRQEVNS